MLGAKTISPQISTINSWPFDDPMTRNQQENYVKFLSSTGICEFNSIDIYSPTSVIQSKKEEYGSFDVYKGDANVKNMVSKKLNHNASERDRRKRINSLYSTLRSLLPPEDQARKLSIPATVSRVVKYIPELQKELERSTKKKEGLISKVPRTTKQDYSNLMDFDHQNHGRKSRKNKPLAAVSATRIGDQEIIVQCSIPKNGKGCSISEAISSLENEGFLVLNASWFESMEGRAFCNLHIQAEESKLMDAETLKHKLWSFYERGEEILLT